MSDNRVEEAMLKFTFNNTQFESGVKQSMSTLLNFRHTITDTLSAINGKAIEGLSNAFKGLNAHELASDVDTISKRFSTMGVIGTTVLQSLTQKAVNLGTSLLHKVLSPINSIWGIVTNRGWARAAGVKQAQFMIDNLGLSWKKAEPIINDAVDGTRFGFDEAATAAAQLATSGVEFGGEMEGVLKAIGNAASMANVEFSDMSNIFTAMASNGRVYGDQLRQFSTRGLNATKALADYLGKTEGEVRELVTKGKVSFTDFYKAINETFGDAAHKADETFTGALANNKAVFARIGQVYASGFMDAALTVLQHTKPKLKEFEKVIKPVGELAGEIMGAIAKYLVPIIDSIKFDKITYFIDNYIKPFGERIKGMITGITEVKETIEDTAEAAEDLLEMANRVIRGDFGNGQVRRDQLEELGYSYERIQNKVNELLGCSFRYEVEEEKVADAADGATDALNEQADAMGKLDKKYTIFENLQRFAAGMSKIIDLGKYMGQTLYDIFENRFMTVLPKILEVGAQALGDFGEAFGDLIDWVVGFDLYGKTLNGFIDSMKLGIDIIKLFTKPFRDFIKEVWESEELGSVLIDLRYVLEDFLNGFTSMGSNISNFFKELSQLSGFSRLLTHFGNAVTWVKDRFVEFTRGVLGAIHYLLTPKIDENKSFFKFFGEDGFFNHLANGAANIIDFFLTLHIRVKKLLALMHNGKMEFFDRITEFVTKHIPNMASSLSDFKGKFSDAFNLSSLENAGDTVRKVFGKIGEYLERIKNLEGVQKMITLFQALGELLKETFLTNLQKMLELIDQTFGTRLKDGEGFINVFGEGGVVDTAAQIIASFIDNLMKAPDALDKFFQKVQKLPQLLSEKSDIGKTIVDAFSTIYKEASKGLPSFFKFISKGITEQVGKSIGKSSLASSPLGKSLDGVVGKIISFIGWVLKADKAVNTAKTSLTDAGESLSGLEDIIEQIKSHDAYKIFKDIADHFKGLKNWDSGDLLTFLKQLAIIKILRKSGDVIGNIAKGIGSFGSIFTSVAGFIDKGGTGVVKVLESFAGLGTSLKTMASSFGTLATNWSDVKGVFKQWRKKPFTTALRDFAIAVALIAGSIALLGSDFVNYERIRENADVLLAFASFFLVLSMILAVTPPETLDGVGKALLGLGIGVLAITAAIGLFGLIPRDVLIQGGVAIAIFMMAMATAVKWAASSGKQATWSFLAIAVALDLLVPAVLALGLMDENVLKRGGEAIVVFMIAMATAAKWAASSGKQATVSFLAIAVALNLLVPAVYLFGKMDLNTLIQGGIAIVAFMMLMAAAVNAAGGSSIGAAVAFLGIAVAINLIVPALMLLTLLKTSKLMGAVMALSFAMMAISMSINVASQNKGALKAAIAMAAATYLVGLALVELASLPMAKVLASAVSLAIVFLSLAHAFKIMQDMDVKKLYASVGALLLVIVGVGAVIWALAEFTNVGEVIGIAVSLSVLILTITAALKLLNGIDPGAAVKVGLAIDAVAALVGGLIGIAAYLTYNIDDLAERLNKFGYAIHAFFAGLFQGKNMDDLNERAEKTEEAGKSMQTFAQSIGEFLEMLDDADETKANNAKALAEAIWALTKTEIVQAVASFIGLTPDFGTFGSAMVQYATAFFDFADAVEEHGDVNTDKMSSILDATSDWIDLANKLGPNVGLFATIAGFTDMGKFGEQMQQFGISFLLFNRYAQAAGTVDVQRIQDIADATEPMIKIADKLEANSGIIPDFIGISDIGKFGTQLASFGEGFKEFYSSLRRIGNIKPERVQTLADAVVPMVEIADSLTNSGGLFQQVFGEKDLSQFGAGLAGLGGNIVEFCQAINSPDIDPDRLNNVVAAMSGLLGMGNDPDAIYYIDSFAQALTQLGVALGTYQQNATGFSPADLLWAVTAFKALAEFFKSISGEEMGGVAEFTKAFTEIGKTSTEKFAESFTTETDEVSRAITSFLKTVATDVSATGAAQFATSGSTSAKGFAEGFNAYSETVVTEISSLFLSAILALFDEQMKYFKARGTISAANFGRGITDNSAQAQYAVRTLVNTALGGFWDVYDRFFTKGQNAAEGFRDGIVDKASEAVRKAEDMANDAIAALARAEGAKSPAKEFIKLGRYASQGYAIGIEKDAALAEDTAREMATQSLMAAVIVASSLAEMIDQNVDTSPVIRPVIDTSGVEYGIGRIDDMFSKSDSITTGMAYRASDIQNQQRAAYFNRMSKDYTDKFDRLIDSNGRIADAVKENRYAIIDGDSAFNYLNRRMGMQ